MSYTWFLMTEVRTIRSREYPKVGQLAWVECYVPERDLTAALDKARGALEAEGFELLDVWRCLRFDLNDWDWETYPESSPAHEIAVRLNKNGDVEFGPFFVSSGEN